MPRRATALVVFSFLAACGSGEPDPRIATPTATIETLLRANHLWRVEAGFLGFRRRGEGREEGGERLTVDIDSVAACFWDYDRDDPSSRAMGVFVAGMLAAGQRDLVYHEGRRTAVVETVHRPVHFRRTRRGWVIVMSATIPSDLRDSIRQPDAPGMK